MLVPDFVENILEKNFLENFPAEACFWFITFSIHASKQSEQIAFLEKSGFFNKKKMLKFHSFGGRKCSGIFDK
jgi:hypothetical protein